MIGKQQITIGADQFAAGLSTGLYTNDGGVAPGTSMFNMFAQPGVLYTTQSTDASTNVTGKMIASAEDSQSVASYNRLLVDNEGGYYTWNGSAITKRHTGSATSKYTFGKTDMVSFAGYTFTTLSDDIARWNTSSLTLVEDWWTNAAYGNQSALSNVVPHPMLVFEGLLWIANGNLLNTVTSALVIAPGVLTLNSNELIYSLGIDPGTGLMLIGVQLTTNYSDTLSSKFFIYLYGAYDPKPRRKIQVEDVVLSFTTSGGTVYIGYGQRIGYFTGSGIQFLRKFSSAVTLDGNNLPYKHHVMTIGNHIMFADGTTILGYGDIVNGKKAWYSYLTNPANNGKFGAIMNLGSNLVGMGFDTDQFWTSDISSTAGGAASALLNIPNLNFPRPIFLRRIRIFTTGIDTSQNRSVTITYTTDRGVSFGNSTVNTTGSTKYVVDQDYGGLLLQTLGLSIGFTLYTAGIIRLVLYYDVAE